jgi:two-component system, cell cycle sensor histidine kinase PleC
MIVPARYSRIRSSGSTQTRRRQEIRFSELEKSQELEDTEAREDDLELEPSFDGPTHEPDRLLKTALSSMAEGLIAIDANSQILLINDALKRFLDLTGPDDLVGRNFEDVLLEVSARGDLGPGDPVAAANSFADRLDRVARAEEPAFEWALPDGRTCLVSSDLLPDEGSIFTFTDVTEQRNALRVMTSARDAAERGNKTKTEFLTRISHELRTPLNSIIGFAGMLRNETLGPLGAKDYREYASNIGDAGETLLAQINAILDVARIEAGTIKLTEAIIDPRTILEAAMATAASREVAFSHFIAPDLPAMRADETRLGQIVAHLLDNALKFLTPGSQVMIRALADHFEGITISVSDEGIGMTDEQVNNAFEPFAQADTALDRQFEGTGLGLSMVKGLVDLHGGRITIASVPNQGTTVSVIFPPERMVLTL